MAGPSKKVPDKAQDSGVSEMEEQEEKPGRRQTRATRLSLQTRDVAGEHFSVMASNIPQKQGAKCRQVKYSDLAESVVESLSRIKGSSHITHSSMLALM